MTVVSDKEFAVNQKRIYNLALNERIGIKRGKNIFYLMRGNVEYDDYADLMEAKSYANDEDTSFADFKKFIKYL